MSLTVYVCTMDLETGKMEDAGFDRPIGAERRRFDFYGPDVARSLGLKLLPTLAESDIYAGGDDLEVLEQEIKIMQENLMFISKTKSDEQDDAKRLGYILQAIEHAKQLHGYVVLW